MFPSLESKKDTYRLLDFNLKFHSKNVLKNIFENKNRLKSNIFYVETKTRDKIRRIDYGLVKYKIIPIGFSLISLGFALYLFIGMIFDHVR